MPILETSISSETIDSYLATDYKVFAAEPFVLNVGKPSVELAEWFHSNDVNQAAYVTAWNPFGERIPDHENKIAEQKLITEIKSRGFAHLKGESSDPSGVWSSEPSLLILGISLESAKELIKKYCQNGFIYIGDDTTPQLILLR